MKSTSGSYFIGLDHLRALAAFMVFAWHFIHVSNGHLASAPIFPLSLLTEGHTGVSLFMTLSGYLFAKLLHDRRIKYLPFIWNRILRLLPLLAVVIVIVGFKTRFSGGNVSEFIGSVQRGWLRPTLPNGGWSITVEFHFYLLLPLLLFLNRLTKLAPLFLLAVALLIRWRLHDSLGQLQDLSYWTIVGRIDQFLCGIFAFSVRDSIRQKNLVFVSIMFLFAVLFCRFDVAGGFYKLGQYPSSSAYWIVLPTIEGIGYAALIGWYDSVNHSTSRLSRFVARIGSYSYSIYLWHFFVVFLLAQYIDRNWIDLSNIYVALAVAPIAFLSMVPIGFFSFNLIESPFLAFRVKYVSTDAEETESRDSEQPAEG